MIERPAVRQEDCLNAHVSSGRACCTRCADICPAYAITVGQTHIPRLDETRCTACTACAAICPADAITHKKVKPRHIIEHVRSLVAQGKTGLRAACSAVSDPSADLTISCHATWDPLLLACLAAEGLRALELNGLTQCTSCSIRHGASMMKQTEKDYALLNKALGVQLEIRHQVTDHDPKAARAAPPVPERRFFFRRFVSSVVQSAAMATATIEKKTIRPVEAGAKPSSGLPIRLRLFL